MAEQAKAMRLATREHAIVNTLLAVMAVLSALYVDIHHRQRVDLTVVPCATTGSQQVKSTS